MSPKSRVVSFPTVLQSEVWPYASVEVIRAEPVTTKLHLSARETIAYRELLSRGRTVLQALESIQAQRALLASLATHRPSPFVCSWCADFDRTVSARGVSHGICPSCIAKLETGGAA
jgi:hypothetical protein